MIDDAYGVLEACLGTLHPGGEQATGELLDAAGVGKGTRLLDLGCGSGRALELARSRGARTLGLDERTGPVRGALARLPFRDDAFDVALAECALCLSDDLGAALSEARRVLDRGGRLAFSDVVLEADLDAPEGLARMLCLDRARPLDDLVAAVEDAGFDVRKVQDRTEDVHAVRDRVHSAVDVEGMLEAMGPKAAPYRQAVDAVESALDAGDLGYVAVVAVYPGSGSLRASAST